jgi:hypothetical protein
VCSLDDEVVLALVLRIRKGVGKGGYEELGEG